MDLFRRLFNWLRGGNVIIDPERAITNETTPENLELQNTNPPAALPSMTQSQPDAILLERVAALEGEIEKLTSWIISLGGRIDRNDTDIENIRESIRRGVQYSPNYVTEEEETIPEHLVAAGTDQQNRIDIPERTLEAGAVQQNRIEEPLVSGQEIRRQQHPNQALSVHEVSTSQPIRPFAQQVPRMSPQQDPNRIHENITVAQCYKMDHKNRGLCMIFTHELFKSSRLSNRSSATKEAKMIEATFKRLGYRVKICTDYTYKKIQKQLRELENLIYPDDDCICICISTHGQEDLLWALDCAYPIDIFENALGKMKKLIGKPKKIFIQACRGKKIDRGISSSRMDSQSEDDTDDSVESKKHPSQADFLIVHSTPYGYVSWRDWFFMALCYILDRFSEKDDIDEILRKTARKICEYESRRNDYRARAKQVPAVYHTLTKKLFLQRK